MTEDCQSLTTLLYQLRNKIDGFRILMEEKQYGQARTQAQIIDGILKEKAEQLDRDHVGLRVRLSKELDLSHVGDFHDGWALATRESDGKEVYVSQVGQFLKDETGRIYEFEPGKADRFSEGIAAAIVGEYVIYIEPDGYRIPGEFKTEQGRTNPQDFRFSGGISEPVKTTGNIRIFIDQNGKEQPGLGTYFGAVMRFSNDGLAKCEWKTNFTQPSGTFGFVFKNGMHLRVGNQEGFVNVTEFSEGYAWVKKDYNSDWQIIDKSGKFIKFEERLASGNITTEVRTSPDSIPHEFHNGWSKVVHPGAEVYFINPNADSLRCEHDADTGQFTNFNVAADFQENMCVVRQNSGEGFKIMDTNGKYLRDKNDKIIELFDVRSKDPNKTDAGFSDGLIECKFLINSSRVKCPWVYMDKRGRVVKFGKKK